jgi:hypothetical protein
VYRSDKDLLKNGPYEKKDHIADISDSQKDGLEKHTFSSTFGPIAEQKHEMSNGSINDRDMPPRWYP